MRVYTPRENYQKLNKVLNVDIRGIKNAIKYHNMLNENLFYICKKKTTTRK